MKHLIATAAIAALLLLGGCSTMSDPRPQIEAIIGQVQQVTVAVCGFLPTVTTVTEILSIGVPGLQTATAIASAICAAVVPPRGVAPDMVVKAKAGKVGGVQVRGRFI